MKEVNGCGTKGLKAIFKFKKRVAQALCVLDEEDGEYPECAGKFFLQKN